MERGHFLQALPFFFHFLQHFFFFLNLIIAYCRLASFFNANGRGTASQTVRDPSEYIYRSDSISLLS